MITAFENQARKTPDALFLVYRSGEDGAAGAPVLYTYWDMRLVAAACAAALLDEGYAEGDYLACSLRNTPNFVALILACSYAGISLVTLNNRLTDEERAERLLTISMANGMKPCACLEEDDVQAWIDAGFERHSESELVHLAERAGVTALRESREIVMFTSGTTGKAKAVVLTGDRVYGAAEVFNATLGAQRETLWQATLPLYHIGGFQVLVRSILNRTPLVLYRHFDAVTVLEDAIEYGATHVSVVDRMLRQMLDAAEANSSLASILKQYHCILLGGAAINEATIARARTLRAPVVASYGMTETSSALAIASILDTTVDGLAPMPGYEACVLNPNQDGIGQLAVKGPGVFDGYLTQRASRTGDGFFITGDSARMEHGRIHMAERVSDMFISGGENVYPAEIARKILQIPDVTDAYVFGERDEEWGRRPVAFVEMAGRTVDARNAHKLAKQVRVSLKQRLSKVYLPDRIFVLQEFPRTGIGKVDRAALEAKAGECLRIESVELIRVRQPFVTPITTAKTVLNNRESLFVRIKDSRGRMGVGECVAFRTPWYLPETLDQDQAFLEKRLIPRVIGKAFLQPDEVYAALMECDGAARHPMAVGALEPAFWDLYGKIVNASIRELIGAKERWDTEGLPATLPSGYAPGGAVIGIASVADTVAAAKAAWDEGYLRLKVKIRPGLDVERVAAIREALPQAMLLLDANQSYTERDEAVLQQLDGFGCVGIEEPLDPSYVPEVGPKGIFERLARLQQRLTTRIFLDESIVTRDDATRALEYPDLRGFVIKPGKWGGVLSSVEFYWRAKEKGAVCWFGGMFETGISKRLLAALSLLPGATIPGDVSSTSRYFATDVATPALTVKHGMLQINPPEAPFGLGCWLDDAALEPFVVLRKVVR